MSTPGHVVCRMYLGGGVFMGVAVQGGGCGCIWWVKWEMEKWGGR